MAKVLYLSYDGMTDPLGQSQVIPYLMGLSKSGHQFHLISFEKNENRNLQGTVAQMLNAGNIQWHPLTYHKSPPVLSGVYDLFLMYRRALKIISENKIDFIHSRSYPSSLVALALKKKKTIPYIFDMRGFWADERVEGNIWQLTNPVYKMIYRYFKQMERKMLNHAGAVVSLTENARKWIISEWHHDEHQAPVTVIPCCCDTNLFQLQSQEKKLAARNSLQIPPNAFVLGYTGSIGTWYMLEEMIQFYKKLHSIRPDTWFLIITRHEHELIRLKAAEHEIRQYKIIAADRQQVAYYLNAVDAAVFFIRPTFSKKASSPVKQAELMAMGIPSVTNAGIGDTDFFFADETPGILVKDFSNDQLMHAAKMLVTKKFDHAAIRQIALNHFALQNGVEAYLKIYQELAGRVSDGNFLHA